MIEDEECEKLQYFKEQEIKKQMNKRKKNADKV